MNRFRAWVSRLRRRFWLWLYRQAGERVGADSDEYWDRHYWRVVRFRLKELAGSDLGLNTLKLIFFTQEDHPDHPREFRPRVREIRRER